MATIRLNYPKISAVAGPCGLWPEDLGPSIKNKSYFENKPYYNFGCAYQRNMAAMVDNPSDLVQPRSETPAYTRAAQRSASRSIARALPPRPPIPKPTRPNSAIQANDQLRAPKFRRAAGRHAAAGGRSHRAGAAGVGAGLLRDGGNRRRRAVGGRGPPPRQGASQDPDGRHGGRHRGLSHRADAERDHPGNRRPQRYPGRPRPARHRLRCRHPRHRDRPHQRRHAVSRTGAPRRQRLRDRAGQHARRGALDLRAVLGAGSQGGRPHHRHRRRQGRRRRIHHRPQRRLGDRARSGAGFRRRRSRPRLRHRRPRLQSGSRRRASPTRCSRPTVSIPPSSTACCRNAPTISACWRRRRRSTGSTISAPTPSIRSSTRFAPRCRASCSTFRINGRAGPSARWSPPTIS